MNRNDFLNMIENTVPVNRQMIGEVYELIDIFPYFQSAHLLLLKGLQTTEDVKFESQLRNSAIHIADREVLYYLLKSKNTTATNQEKITQITNTPVVSDNIQQQTVIESAKNSLEIINEIERDSGVYKQEELKDSYHESAGHTIMISSESENDMSDGVMLLSDEDETPGEEKFFYMDPGIPIPEQSDLLELDTEEESFDLIEEDVNAQLPAEDQKMNLRKQLQSELIDKFIIANPRIEPNKDKSIHPLEDISRPFVEEEGGFVTETLARIFINQGYYSKAIDIYEKLSLKFPEKSSYFASQIEKVKEYIKK